MKQKAPHCDPALSSVLCQVLKKILFSKAHQTQPALDLKMIDQVTDNLSTIVAQGGVLLGQRFAG